MKAGKGSGFERDFCRLLTLWWVGEPFHDVMFWRTSQSGGRATSRKKGGKDAAHSHCGDISAIHPDGEPLTKLITWELKRGYSKYTPYDVIDASEGAAVQEFQKWVNQAQESSRLAKTPYWAIVHKRDRRDTMIFFPRSFYEDAETYCNIDLGVFPILGMAFKIEKREYNVVGMKLETFFEKISKTDILRIRANVRK